MNCPKCNDFVGNVAAQGDAAVTGPCGCVHTHAGLVAALMLNLVAAPDDAGGDPAAEPGPSGCEHKA